MPRVTYDVIAKDVVFRKLRCALTRKSNSGTIPVENIIFNDGPITVGVELKTEHRVVIDVVIGYAGELIVGKINCLIKFPPAAIKDAVAVDDGVFWSD